MKICYQKYLPKGYDRFTVGNTDYKKVQYRKSIRIFCQSGVIPKGHLEWRKKCLFLSLWNHLYQDLLFFGHIYPFLAYCDICMCLLLWLDIVQSNKYIYTVKSRKQLELYYNTNSCITLLKMQKTYYAI